MEKLKIMVGEDNGWGRYYHHAVTREKRKERHYHGYLCGWDLYEDCVNTYGGEDDNCRYDIWL